MVERNKKLKSRLANESYRRNKKNCDARTEIRQKQNSVNEKPE